MKRRIFTMFLVLISILSFSISAFAETETTDEKSFTKNGMQYIEKSYTLDNDEDISELTGSSFELNGLSYHQVNIESKPVIEVLEKNAEMTEKTTVSSKDSALVVESLGAVKDYTDDEGYSGVLALNTDKITYTVEEYATKTYTKTDERRYYNLPSMDTSQISKSVWLDGIELKLNDIIWIGDNNSASAETAVGNNYHAKALYKGSYSVRVPSLYSVEAVFEGVAEKEFSDRTEYIVTYLGEETVTPVKEDTTLPLITGVIILNVLMLAGGIYLYRKMRNKETEEIKEEAGENED